MEKKDQDEIKNKIRKAEALRDGLSYIEDLDIDKAYLRTKTKIRRSERKDRFITFCYRAAAVLAIPLLVAAIGFGNAYFKSRKGPMQSEITAANGCVVRQLLPDSTEVWLNSGSSLKYNTTLGGKRRDVNLDGEAYFHVKADRRRPFYVHVPGGFQVYVYGTKFNVEAYASDSLVRTTLVEGHVNVITPDNSEAVLNPGYAFNYDKVSHKLTPSKVDVEALTSWKDGILMFRDTPIEEVMKDLGRHFNVDIDFHNHSGKTYRYRATFTDESFAQIMDYLGRSADLRWEKTGGELQPDGTLTKEKIRVDLF